MNGRATHVKTHMHIASTYFRSANGTEVSIAEVILKRRDTGLQPFQIYFKRLQAEHRAIRIVCADTAGTVKRHASRARRAMSAFGMQSYKLFSYQHIKKRKIMLFKYLTPITDRVCRSFSHTWAETCNQNRPPERQKQPNGNDASAGASPTLRAHVFANFR